MQPKANIANIANIAMANVHCCGALLDGNRMERLNQGFNLVYHNSEFPQSEVLLGTIDFVYILYANFPREYF
jgi:hypothetical protein